MAGLGMPVASAYDFAGLAALKGSANKADVDQGSVNKKWQPNSSHFLEDDDRLYESVY